MAMRIIPARHHFFQLFPTTETGFVNITAKETIPIYLFFGRSTREPSGKAIILVYQNASNVVARYKRSIERLVIKKIDHMFVETDLTAQRQAKCVLSMLVTVNIS